MPLVLLRKGDGGKPHPADTTMTLVAEAQVPIPNVSFQDYEDKGQQSPTKTDYKDHGRFEQGNGH